MSYVQRYNKIVAWLGIRMFFCLTHLSACAVNMLGATSVIVLRCCFHEKQYIQNLDVCLSRAMINDWPVPHG